VKKRFGCIPALLVCLTLPLVAQTTNNVATSVTTASSTTVSAAATVPPLITFSGTLNSESGENGVVLAPGAAPTRVVAITFSLYADQTGGAPLWSEVQNVRVDSAGHYTVQLGATTAEGLPMEIFSSVQAQWLGVQPQGQAEEPRVMVVSVPYALKAADAETFGGLPPSAYALAPPSAANLPPGKGPSGKGGAGDSPHQLPLSGSGTPNYIPLWTSASELASSGIYQDPTHGYIGIGTTTPAASLYVKNDNFFPLIAETADGALPAFLAINDSTLSGNAIGGQISGPGIAILGTVMGTTGTGTGVSGTTMTPMGAGVIGDAGSPTAMGVAGFNTATTGAGIGVYGSSDAPSGAGVVGTTASMTGAEGVYGFVNGPNAIGVYGQNMATGGSAYGVVGTTASTGTNASGVYGQATARQRP